MTSFGVEIGNQTVERWRSVPVIQREIPFHRPPKLIGARFRVCQTTIRPAAKNLPIDRVERNVVRLGEREQRLSGRQCRGWIVSADFKPSQEEMVRRDRGNMLRFAAFLD